MIYTFYSFKGGVGRSMALASVAYLLASRGLKVLTIDFDLEAPGLERYFFEPGAASAAKARPGLVDLLLAYKRALSSEEEFRKGEFRDWRRFVQPALPTLARSGSVDIMTAGQREPAERYGSYATAVRAFDWLDFFHHWKGERFFDWLRAEFVGDSETPGAYDAVLVDSRTGITEMGGVCAYQLADVAVMLCAANDQNLEGTLRVAQDFRSDATLALRHGRRLDILVIPARLEAHNAQRQHFLDEFQRRFDPASYLPRQLAELSLNYERLALPYEPAFAIIEQIVGEQAAAGGVDAAAVRTFRQLANALVLLAWRPGRLLERQAQAREEILGQADGPGLQRADPTRAVADFDLFLDDSAWPGNTRLAAALREAGVRVATLGDGVSSEASLAQSGVTIVQASRVLMVLFHSDQVSPWTSTLIDAARAHNRPIVPLVVAGSSDAPAWQALARASLAHLHAVQLDARQPDGWAATVLRAWKQLYTSPGPADDGANEASPYPGTRPFAEADARFFFGRAAPLDALVKLLDTAEVALLVGAAGVGKTSLVCAGLLPARRAAMQRTLYLELAPESELLAGLAAWLRQAAGEPGLVVLDGVDSLPRGADAMAVQQRIDDVAVLLDALPAGVRALLVLRNSWHADQRAAALARWRLQRGGRRTLRFDLAPLDAEGLAQAVEKPAAWLGHVVDPGLTALLVNQAGSGPGAVAELARALPVLWQGRRRGWLTAAALEAQGGIAGLFGSAWQRFVADLPAPERDAAHGLVRMLSRLDDAMRWRAGMGIWDVLATVPALQAVDAVALRDRLAGQHFIDLWSASGEGNGPVEAKSTGTLPPGELKVALVHETPAVYGTEHVVPIDPSFQLWRQRFAAYVTSWQRSGRIEAALLPEQALAEAQLHLERHPNLLSEPERSLIAQSRARQLAALKLSESERQERERLQQQALFQQRVRLVFGISSLLLAAVLVWALYERVQANRAEREALAQKQVAEDRLARMKSIIAQVPDPVLRARLSGEHLPGETPVLTPAEQQQVQAKAEAPTAGNWGTPRADPLYGMKLWRNGSTLRMRFLGGSAAQQALVRQATDEWSRFANLKFQVVDSGDAELRITFIPSGGSWSYLGTDALGRAQDQPTMNLPYPSLGSVLHEFGHVLGLIHENENPNADLPWDMAAAYRLYTGAPYHWSREAVDQNLRPRAQVSGYRSFDERSIMMYPFPALLFTDGRARGGAEVLSDSDKAFAAQLYPR